MSESYKGKQRASGKKGGARGSYQNAKSAKNRGKVRKKGRAKAQAISGFSTLSQVSGAPLVRAHHSSIPVPVQKTVSEPLGVCPLCGERIQAIAECFSLPEGYAHFDCVLERIKSHEHLLDGESVSYIGSGTFAVCRKGDDGRYTIEKRIEVESRESYNSFKSYVESLKA